TKPVTEQRLDKTLEKIRRKHPVNANFPEPRRFPRPLREHIQIAALTDKEISVLRLMASGLSNKEIAVRLNIAAETVKWHLKNTYRKLDVSNRVQALQRVQELNIFE